MNNKHFGDDKDFYKYALLRILSRRFKIGVCWMLTPEKKNKDKSNDGGVYKYLENNRKKFCGENQDLLKIYDFFTTM